MATSGTHNDTVSDYLERYRSVDVHNLAVAGEWKIADNFLNMPQAQLKLRGSMGVGGTFHIKLVWNSDPMLRGLGILAYLPPGVENLVKRMQSSTGLFEVGMYLSGCPHVYVNLAQDSSVELSVPYVGETIFAPAYQNPDPGYHHAQIGTFFFHPLVQPTVAAGAVEVKTHVYMKMSNVTTFGNYPSLPSYQMEEALPLVESIKKSKVVSSTTGKISKWLNSNKDEGIVGTISRGDGSWVDDIVWF